MVGFPSSMHQETAGAGFDPARSPREPNPRVDCPRGPARGIAVPAPEVIEAVTPA